MCPCQQSVKDSAVCLVSWQLTRQAARNHHEQATHKEKENERIYGRLFTGWATNYGEKIMAQKC